MYIPLALDSVCRGTATACVEGGGGYAELSEILDVQGGGLRDLTKRGRDARKYSIDLGGFVHTGKPLRLEDYTTGTFLAREGIKKNCLK
jgi:hypothetical protein